MKTNIFLLLSIFLFTSCSSSIPTPKQRETNIDNLIGSTYTKKTLPSKDFNFYSVEKLNSCKDSIMSVYIEGDGLAWITKSRISQDPTPINPLSLKLMLKDKSLCKIYIARPCQYNNTKSCEKKYWTSHRFSQIIIDSFQYILDNLKKDFQNNSFKLIGYSGGGAIATLLSANRDDISNLMTVAGNIDTKKWTDIHHISPLYNSLNPADFSTRLQSIPQLHLVGENDKIIPIDIFNSYLSNFKNKKNIQYSTFKGFSHSKGWVENWDIIINKN